MEREEGERGGREGGGPTTAVRFGEVRGKKEEPRYLEWPPFLRNWDPSLVARYLEGPPDPKFLGYLPRGRYSEVVFFPVAEYQHTSPVCCFRPVEKSGRPGSQTTGESRRLLYNTANISQSGTIRYPTGYSGSAYVPRYRSCPQATSPREWDSSGGGGGLDLRRRSRDSGGWDEHQEALKQLPASSLFF